MSWQKGDLSVDGFLSVAKEVLQGDNKRELPTLPTVTEKQPEENLSYQERMEKGDYYFDHGFLSFAANEYARAANLEPNRVDPYRKLLVTHFELRNYRKALSNAETVLALNPTHAETLYDVLRIHIRLSDFESAKGLADSYQITDATDARILYYKGLLEALNRNHELAQKLLKEARVKSDDPSLDKDTDVMLEAYREFEFTQAAQELFLSELIARGFNKVEEYEMAIHLLKEVLKERGDLRDGWILLGFAYLNLEKYQFALTALDRAYSLDPEWTTTQYFLGIAHMELDHSEDSINYFSLALTNGFEPQVVVYRHLANLYFEAEAYDQSVAAYEKVLELSEADVSAYIRPVWIYIDFIDDSQKAKTLAETAVLNFPESAMSYNLLGWSYIGLGQSDKAERNLKKALELEPNLAAAHYNLGHLYETQNREQLALDSYQQAYELDGSGSIGNRAAAAYNELLRTTSTN